MGQITAIFVTYNSAGVIGRALASLAGKPGIAAIIVVDNASRDETCALIRRDFPNVTLIANPENAGFGRGNNIALERVETPYALLINPDAALEEGTLPALLAAARRNPDAAIIAPSLYDERGDIDRSFKRNVFAREKRRAPFVTPEGDLCAEFLSGALWLLDMTIMREVGFFDPHIFLYYEDDDLCLRARRKGYALVLAHEARALHLKGASSGPPSPEAEFFKQRHMLWSRLYIEQKYKGRFAARKLGARLKAEYALKAIAYGLTGNKLKFRRYQGRVAGILDFTSKAASIPAASA